MMYTLSFQNNIWCAAAVVTGCAVQLHSSREEGNGGAHKLHQGNRQHDGAS